MERIDSYPALATLAGGYLRRGVCTNTVVSPEEYAPAIRTGRLWAWAGRDGLLLLRRYEGHYRLTFYLNDLTVPLPRDLPRPTVAEVAYRPRDLRLREAVDYLRAQGFALLFERVRLSRPAAPVETGDVPLEVAGPGDEAAVGQFLAAAFPALTGCLPFAEELAAGVRAGRFLACRDGGGIAGLIHSHWDGKSMEICHLAVREDLRGRGLAKALVAGALSAAGGVRAQVWVRDGYVPAQRAYAAMGFVPDGRRSAVLCLDGGSAVPSRQG